MPSMAAVDVRVEVGASVTLRPVFGEASAAGFIV
jgi:hypothetical protein